jgi:integrase
MVSAKPVPMDALMRGQEWNSGQSVGTGTLDVRGQSYKSLNITRPDELETIPAKAPGRKKTGHHSKRPRQPNGKFKRGLRSMGKYPYLMLLEQYLKDRKEIRRIADSTLRNERRMLRLLHRDIQALRTAEKISTTNPKKMSSNDITEIMRYLNTRGIRPAGRDDENRKLALETIDKHVSKGDDDRLDQDTIAKYMQYLGSFLTWAGNPAMARFKELDYLPKRSGGKKIESLDSEDALYLFDESQNVSGWEGDILAFTIPAFIVQGFRGQELFKAELQDLDTRKWRFFIRYPKGGKKKQVKVRIHPILQPYVIKYLEARERELHRRGVESSIHLFPSMRKFKVMDKPYTPSFHRCIKELLERKTNISFTYQMLRRTSGQYLKDQGEDIEAVSKHLRHTSTSITEKYYARMRDEEADDRISERWSRSPLGKGLVTT